MELVLTQLPALLTGIWWPFCRVLGMLSASPILGDNMVPITVRVLLALVLAVVLMPIAQPAVTIEPLSAHAIVVTLEQVLLGFAIGLAFHLTLAVMAILGFTVSSQAGLAMAALNDPMSGVSSDVISALLYVLYMLVFFAIDGHLVLVSVVGSSFRAWPVGGGIDLASFQNIALHLAWVLAAALLLALPVIFSALVVQLGFGFLNRVAPSLNLFALGFSIVTIFGLFMLGHVVRSIPEHYVRMTNQVLELLRLGMR
ncbi:MAG: flagellar biosynthetic protein FliR [Steroidobacteraceae bacterium]|nr:flagellar biosynthetic protein FliR [Steroidobacteraceae bacterium]